MEQLPTRLIRRQRVIHAEWPRIPKAVLADERPVRVRVTGLEREREVGTEFGLSGGDGCGHVAGFCVDEDADWCISVGGVGDGDIV